MENSELKNENVIEAETEEISKDEAVIDTDIEELTEDELEELAKYEREMRQTFDERDGISKHVLNNLRSFKSTANRSEQFNELRRGVVSGEFKALNENLDVEKAAQSAIAGLGFDTDHYAFDNLVNLTQMLYYAYPVLKKEGIIGLSADSINTYTACGLDRPTDLMYYVLSSMTAVSVNDIFDAIEEGKELNKIGEISTTAMVYGIVESLVSNPDFVPRRKRS